MGSKWVMGTPLGSDWFVVLFLGSYIFLGAKKTCKSPKKEALRTFPCFGGFGFFYTEKGKSCDSISDSKAEGCLHGNNSQPTVIYNTLFRSRRPRF